MDTDFFWGYAIVFPLRSISALFVAKAFCEHWVFVYGPQRYLLTDNGTQFTAKFFLAVCRDLGIAEVFTTANHPQTNGQFERFNRTILNALRGYVASNQRDWDDYTSTITLATTVVFTHLWALRRSRLYSHVLPLPCLWRSRANAKLTPRKFSVFDFFIA
jgi:hypothetical protein